MKRPPINQTSLFFDALSWYRSRTDCKHFLHHAALNRVHGLLTASPCSIHLSELSSSHSHFPARTLSCICSTNSQSLLKRPAFHESQIGSLSTSSMKTTCSQTSAFWKKSMEIQQRSFCDSAKLNSSVPSTLPGEVDRYKGVWVDLATITKDGLSLEKLSEEEFDTLLKASMKSWKAEGLTSAWLNVPITLGRFLPVASKYGFTFHHAEGHQVTLSLWMDKVQESKIPRFATHQMGVSGLVINEDTREILVVQDKNRPYQLWKFPGGLSDLGEDIATTAEREVFEETGLKTEFQSVLAFRQQHSHPGAFGRSDLYVLCRLKPLTFDLHPCEEEIAACQWMPIDKLKGEVHASSLTHKLADLVLLGLERGFSHVDISSYQMASIYKGLKFHIFHRPLQ